MCAERAPQPPPSGPGEDSAFGEALRRAREAAGISLEAVSRRTRIAPHHLEALERSDLAALPTGPFGKSYLRAYAEVLGVDPEPLLAAYRLREGRGHGDPAADERRMLEQLSQAVSRGARESEAAPGLRRPLLFAGTAAAIATLAVAGWLAVSPGRRHQDAPVPSAPPPSGPSPSGAPPSAAPPPRATPRPQPPPRTAPPVAAPSTPASERSAPVASLPTAALHVAGFGVGTAVAGRRLVGRADRFPEGERVVFWTEVMGGRPGHVVRHTWFQEGRAVMRVDLHVGGPHWRTQSSLVLPRGGAGTWTVEARTSDGRLLARNDFACERPRPGER